MSKTYPWLCLCTLLCAAPLFGQAQPNPQKPASAPPFNASSQEPLPDAPEPQPALTVKEKLHVFLRRTYSPITFTGAAFNAGIDQAAGAWRGYGGGMQGYGKRFGASLADNESSVFFGHFLFPTLLHQDPRYLPSERSGFFHRLGHAVSRVFITQSDSGKTEFNTSLFLSVSVAAPLANTYYPRSERTLGDTFGRAGNMLIGAAEMNILHEFWPGVRKKLMRHDPSRPAPKLAAKVRQGQQERAESQVFVPANGLQDAGNSNR